MKKFLFAIFTAIFTISVSYATTQCIQWPTASTSKSNDILYTPDWRTRWDDGFEVKGIGVCGNKVGSANDVSNSISVSGNVSENLICWCKMIYPAVSLWQLFNYYSSASECAINCAADCGFNVGYYRNVRQIMFNSVGN